MTIRIYNRHSGQPVLTKWVGDRVEACGILAALEYECEGTDYGVERLD